MLVYEVKFWDRGLERSVTAEYSDKAEAERRAEQLVLHLGQEQATVITWSVEPNLPRCKPDLVYRSSAMSVFRRDGWYDCAIHDPHYQEWAR